MHDGIYGAVAANVAPCLLYANLRLHLPLDGVDSKPGDIMVPVWTRVLQEVTIVFDYLRYTAASDDRSK